MQDRKQISRKSQRSLMLYLSILSLLLVSFASVGFGEFSVNRVVAASGFEAGGVGVESSEETIAGSLTWQQLAEVDKVRLENLSESETIKELFSKTFEVHGVFGETHSGQIMRDWSDLGNEIGTTATEAKEVYRLWQENSEKNFEALGLGDEAAWDTLFEKREAELISDDTNKKNKSWETFASENGLVGGALLLAGMFATWRRKRENEDKDYGEQQGLYEKVYSERTGTESWKNLYNKVHSSVTTLVQKKRSELYNSYIKDTSTMPKFTAIAPTLVNTPTKNYFVLQFESIPKKNSLSAYARNLFYQRPNSAWIGRYESAIKGLYADGFYKIQKGNGWYNERSIKNLTHGLKNQLKQMLTYTRGAWANISASDRQRARQLIAGIENGSLERNYKRMAEEKIKYDQAVKNYATKQADYRRKKYYYDSLKRAHDWRVRNWYAYQNRRAYTESNKLYTQARSFFFDKANAEIYRQKFLQTAKNAGANVLQNINKYTQSREQKFNNELQLVLKKLTNEDLEQVKTNDDSTGFDWKSKGIDISKKETNQVLTYLKSIKNYKNIRYFAEQSEQLETLSQLEAKKKELLSHKNTSEYDGEINNLQKLLSQKNELTYEEYLNTPGGRHRREWHEATNYRYFANSKRMYGNIRVFHSGIGRYQYGGGYKNLYKEYRYNIQNARGNFNLEEKLAKIKKLEEIMHEEKIRSYNGWERYYKEHPLEKSAKDEQRKLRLEQLKVVQAKELALKEAQIKAIDAQIEARKKSAYTNFVWMNSSTVDRSKHSLTDTIVAKEIESETKSSFVVSTNNFIENLENSLEALQTKTKTSLATAGYPPIRNWRKSSYKMMKATREQYERWNTPEGQIKRQNIYNRAGNPDEDGAMEAGKRYRREAVTNSTGNINYKYVEIDNNGNDVVNTSTTNTAPLTAKEQWLAERKAQNYATQLQAGDLVLPLAVIQDKNGKQLTGNDLTTAVEYALNNNQGYFRSDVEAVSTDESTSTQVDESTSEEEITTESILTEAEQLAQKVKAANEAKQKEIDLQTQAEYEAELAAAREKVLSFGNGPRIELESVFEIKSYQETALGKLLQSIKRGEVLIKNVSSTQLGSVIPLLKIEIQHLNSKRSWWDKLTGKKYSDELREMEQFVERYEQASKNTFDKALGYVPDLVSGAMDQLVKTVAVTADSFLFNLNGVAEGLVALAKLLATNPSEIIEMVKPAFEEGAHTLQNGTPKEQGEILFEIISSIGSAGAGQAKNASSFLQKVQLFVKNAKNVVKNAVDPVVLVKDAATGTTQFVKKSLLNGGSGSGKSLLDQITDLTKQFTDPKNITRENVKKLLNFSEEGFGHTIEKHVAKSDDFLKNRVQNNIAQFKNVDKPVSPSTSFHDRATAEKAIRDALQSPEVQKTIKNAINASKNNSQKAFNPQIIDLQKNIGYGFEAVDGVAKKITTPLTKIQIQLKPNGKGGFEILSSFPVK